MRLRTSGENLLDLLFMTLSSQKLEPPSNPGRFRSFKTDEYKSLEKNKKDLFWQHQLRQVERKLQSYRKSIDFNYEESTHKARQLRDQSIRDSYTSAIASASSDLERISLNNSFRVSRAENLASDLKADGDYQLNKLITEREIRNLEALKALIVEKLGLR